MYDFQLERWYDVFNFSRIVGDSITLNYSIPDDYSETNSIDISIDKIDNYAL